MNEADFDAPPVRGQFGSLPPELVSPVPGDLQFSPLIPGSARLEAAAPCSLDCMTMHAPPETIVRRRELALMLRALRPGAPFTVLAGKQSGGQRLGSELTDLGCTFEETAKRHFRICTGRRHDPLDEPAIAAAIAEGAPRFVDEIGVWSQPGLFSWNKIDPGTALLLAQLPAFSGEGADFGCGTGLLAHAVLHSRDVDCFHMIDIDRRAIDVAQRNVDDPRVRFSWADVRDVQLEKLDFVVSNAPFHESGRENRNLGIGFIDAAAAALRRGGQFWLVANLHLPYERKLADLFRNVDAIAKGDGFKVLAALK